MAETPTYSHAPGEYPPGCGTTRTPDQLDHKRALKPSAAVKRPEREAIEAARAYAQRLYGGSAGTVGGYRGGLLRERGGGGADALLGALQAALRAAFGRRVGTFARRTMPCLAWSESRAESQNERFHGEGSETFASLAHSARGLARHYVCWLRISMSSLAEAGIFVPGPKMAAAPLARRKS